LLSLSLSNSLVLTSDFGVLVSGSSSPQGKVQKYRVVLQQLDTTDANALVLWYHALQSCASALGAEFHDLVNVSLKLDVARAPTEVLEPFMHFLTNLLSANSCYAKPCFQCFVRFLLPVFNPPRIPGTGGRIDAKEFQFVCVCVCGCVSQTVLFTC
jgi:RNA polymerase I specific transcription initiation factor RRN3